MTLKNCTKEELIFIVERLSFFDKAHLERLLYDVEYERVKKKLAEAKRWGEVAASCRQKYADWLKKYHGTPLSQVPMSEIKEADKALKDAEKADREYDKLMKEVEAYGR